MKYIRAAVWAGTTVAVLAATTACGGAATKKAADAVSHADAMVAALTRASDKASKLGSAEVETKTTLAGTGSKPVLMNGTYSWGDGAALDVMMDTASAQMQALQDDPTLTMKMVDGAYYYQVDPQPGGPLKGKHWMRIDVSAVLGESGAQNVMANADPTAGLHYLGAAKDVKDLGEETVRGKKATHYRGGVSTAQVEASHLPAKEKRAAVKALAASGGRTDFDVWVDGNDLPVRMQERSGGVAVTMDFLKFGATKPITAPPAADTGDLTKQVESQRDQALGQ